jgi:hypothetical protein
VDGIRRIKVVGEHKDAPRCAYPGCGKILLDSEKEHAPYCRRCGLILKMESAVNDLKNSSGK